MKVFISQPMNGLSDEDILKRRAEIITKIHEEYGNDLEVLDTFFRGVAYERKPLWYLAKSLELLAQADMIYMSKGWTNTRGCRIEYLCAKEYNITRIVYEDTTK